MLRAKELIKRIKYDVAVFLLKDNNKPLDRQSKSMEII